MKKRLTALLLAVLIGVLLSSCKTRDSSLDIELDTGDKSKFIYAEKFYLPMTPKEREHTVGRPEKLYYAKETEELVDALYGDGSFMYGELEPEDGTAFWTSNDESKSVTVYDDGSFVVYDYVDSNHAYPGGIDPDSVGERIFETDFNETRVELDGVGYTLNELCRPVQERLELCIDKLGMGLDIKPLYATIDSKDGRQLYVTFSFCAALGGGYMRSTDGYYEDMLYSADNDTFESIPAPVITAMTYGPEHIFSMSLWYPFSDDTAAGETDIITSEQAVNAASDKLGTKAGHITLKYAQLEYLPKYDSLGRFKALPYWAFYCTDENGEEGIICVDAVTEELSIIRSFSDS